MATPPSTSTGVPPGFRFHPTDEELLLYYLKRKVTSEKFDIEVVREVDLNKIEPWELQERCRIGATPQNEWYFFSYKDRKYPTGSRTNRATNAGFWKATGRDKCIRTTYKKIGMRKTLVFYRGRAPHGQKSDWIMHEYRLEDSDDDDQCPAGSEDGWVVCRVFKKKCFFRAGGTQGSSSQVGESNLMNSSTSLEQSRALYNYQHQNLHHHFNQQATNMYKHELALDYMPANPYTNIQLQDLLPNHRASAGYDFSALPADHSSAVVKPLFEATGLGVGGCEAIRDAGASDWAVLDNVEARYGNGGGGASPVRQINPMSQPQRGSEMDLWGYGK